MRVTTKYMLTSAVSLMTLAGCGNAEDEPEAYNDYPEFSAIVGHAQSRVSGTSWEANDQIGITGSGRTNVCYETTDGKGTFKVKSEDPIKFKGDDETTFTAYYPWTDKLTEGVISVSTEDQAKQEEFDFLWATAIGKKAEPNVKFEFSHKMAKLVITIKPGDGVEYDKLSEYIFSLGGICLKGEFNIEAGNATPTGDPAEAWAINKFGQSNEEEKKITLSLIVLPQTFENNRMMSIAATSADNSLSGVIDFTEANEGKDGDDAKNELVAGRQYNLSMTLRKTGLSFGSCTISDWEKADLGEIPL